MISACTELIVQGVMGSSTPRCPKCTHEVHLACRCLVLSLREHAFLKGILLKWEADGQDGVFEDAVSKGGVVRNITVSLEDGKCKVCCRPRGLGLDKSPDSDGNLEQPPLDWTRLCLQEVVRTEARHQLREGSRWGWSQPMR